MLQILELSGLNNKTVSHLQPVKEKIEKFFESEKPTKTQPPREDQIKLLKDH